MDETPRHLTELLQRWGLGDAAAFEQLIPEVYPELRVMARRCLSGEQPATIQATGLVHDLYLRLLRQDRKDFVNRRAFFGFAAGAMRQILIDHVRARRATKRGGYNARVPLTDDLPFVDVNSDALLDLNDALEELVAIDPRKAELIQLTAFLGCGRAEAAELLDISHATAKRDFRLARAWLAHRLSRTPVEE